MSLSFRVPAESWAARSITLGIGTSGARPAGSGAKGLRNASVGTVRTLGTLACGSKAGGVMKINTTTGSNSSHVTRLACECP